MEQVYQNQILQQYQDYQENLQAIEQKILELQSDVDEHRLVCATLVAVDPSRRCFRMVAGTLVERNVGEVLPQLQANATALEGVISRLEAQRGKLVGIIKEMAQKYNIRRVDESQGPAPSAPAASTASSGEGVGILV